MSSESAGPILSVQGLKKHFPVRAGRRIRGVRPRVKAVDGVDFHIMEGETLGLVGESGCGKTTVGRLILRLIDPTAGKIVFEGRDVSDIPTAGLMEYRRQVQIIFQDPYSSLNPRMAVGKAIAEPLISHGLAGKHEAFARAMELLAFMGLSEHHFHRYPHEFSGGQRQRIGIARALSLRPRLIVADEPVSALDVSIQAQIINLLEEIRAGFGMTYLFISHDLGVVRHISDRVAVMYLGRVVELAGTEALFEKPLHPYTEALLSAVPVTHPRERRKRILLKGDVPSPLGLPPGCAFHTRCHYAMAVCRNQRPEFRETEPGRLAACHLLDKPST
ncbi:MAG: ATP-binding cassette domain-containing protein [Proteobacteria bacterium]|nr:ATP-binding cassette domain-containing protein [Pseudomonadota bacterium]